LHQFDTLNNLKKAQAPGYLGNSPPGSYVGTEPTLDVQYITSHGLGAKTYFWTIDGWMYTFATEIFNQQNPEGPLVNSISYAWPEGDQCDPMLLSECAYGNEFNGNSGLYMNATNIEWMKLGLKGHTILASSGDQGAPGDFNLVCDNYTNPLGPLYPTSSPYIISVGATAMAGSGNGIFLAENLASQHETPQIKKSERSTSTYITTPNLPTIQLLCWNGRGALYSCQRYLHYWWWFQWLFPSAIISINNRECLPQFWSQASSK